MNGAGALQTPLQTPDRVGWYTLSWRIYLTCVATSFMVMIEPAPTDLFFVIALGVMMLAQIPRVRLIGAIEVVAIVIYVWFTLLSLLFVEHALGVAVRAVFIEFYLLLLFLMTAYFVHRDGDRAFRVILIALLIGGVITSLIGILAWLNLLPNRVIFFRDEHMSRIKSTFKDPNVLGPYLIPSLLAALWTMVTVPRLRMLGGAAAGILMLCLLLTFSRGAWAHMLVTAFCFFLALLADRRTVLPTVLVALGTLAAGLLGVLVFADTIFGSVENSYLSSRLSLQSYDDSRFAHILESIGHSLDRPLGIGPNQAPFEFGYEPHNTFVILALQNGLPAAFGFALLYGAAMVHCLVQVLRQQEGWVKHAFVLSVMLGLLLLMNVVGSLHWRHIYVVLGLAYGRYASNDLFPARPAKGRAQVGAGAS